MPLRGPLAGQDLFCRPKDVRRIATRYDKCPENDLAAVKRICARI